MAGVCESRRACHSVHALKRQSLSNLHATPESSQCAVRLPSTPIPAMPVRYAMRNSALPRAASSASDGRLGGSGAASGCRATAAVAAERTAALLSVPLRAADAGSTTAIERLPPHADTDTNLHRSNDGTGSGFQQPPRRARARLVADPGPAAPPNLPPSLRPHTKAWPDPSMRAMPCCSPSDTCMT